METAVVPSSRRPRRFRRFAVIAFALTGLAATSRVVWVDVINWRESVREARSVGMERGRSDQEYIDAAFVLQRDVLQSIRVIRHIRDQGEPAASESAAAALQNISQAASR